MFPIKAKTVLPIQHIVLHGIAVRGQLGPLTVWISHPDSIPDATGTYHFRLLPEEWTKIYEKRHDSSQHELCFLDLEDNPIVLWPGQVRAVYVHSTLPGDEAIVYDNTHPDDARSGRPRHEDAWLRVPSGKAHLCPEPFGQVPIWGWGNAWRDHREFVGRLQYGIRYQLWHPHKHAMFGPRYRAAIRTCMLMQRRGSSDWSRLPDECIYYIAHVCPWDWFGDTTESIQQDQDRQKRLREEKLEEEKRKREEEEAQQKTDESAISSEPMAEEPEGKMAAKQRPGRRQYVPCPPVRGEESDNVYYDAAEDFDDSDSSWNDDHADMEESQSDYHMDVILEVDNENEKGRRGASNGQDNQNDADAEDEEDDDEDDEGSNTSAWERANGYRADSNVFRYQDPDLLNENGTAANGNGEGREAQPPAWFRLQRGEILEVIMQP
jgi:hypothetical protein